MLFWSRIDVFRTRPGSFVPWLIRVARNRGIDRLRARQRRRKLSTRVGAIAGTSSVCPVSTEPDEAGYAFWPLQTHLHAVLAALPDGQQATVRLAYFEGSPRPR